MVLFPQIPSNYLDIAELEDYWSPRHLNHHTEATSMQYAVHEALRCVMLEGLQERFARHALNDKALCAGLQAMGLKIFGDLKHKMPCVTAICIPEGIDGPTLRGQALRDFGIEYWLLPSVLWMARSSVSVTWVIQARRETFSSH